MVPWQPGNRQPARCGLTDVKHPTVTVPGCTFKKRELLQVEKNTDLSDLFFNFQFWFCAIGSELYPSFAEVMRRNPNSPEPRRMTVTNACCTETSRLREWTRDCLADLC